MRTVVVHTPHWLVGGVERVLCLLMSGWVASGRKVYLATPRVFSPQLPIPEGIERLEMPGNPGARKQVWGKLVEELGIEAVIFNSYEDIAGDLLFLQDQCGVRCIRIHHGSFAATLATMPLGKWLRDAETLARAEMTVCLNHFDARALGMAGYERVRVIPNPVAADYGWPEDGATRGNVALYVGRLAVEKNIDQLISCFSTIASQVPAARLWLTAVPGSLAIAAVERTIRRAGLEKRVVLLPAVADPREYYRQAAFLVLPSCREGFGMVIIEGKKFSLPTVMFDLENNESVRDGYDGLKASPGDFGDFAGKMLRLFRDEELRRRLGANALASGREYDLPLVAARWEELFAALDRDEEPETEREMPAPDLPFCRQALRSIAAAQDEFDSSFYSFLHRHPVFMRMMRGAKEHLARGSFAWRVWRGLWFKVCVPLVSKGGTGRAK